MNLSLYQIIVIVGIVLAFIWIIRSFIRGDDDTVPTEQNTDWWEADND